MLRRRYIQENGSQQPQARAVHTFLRGVIRAVVNYSYERFPELTRLLDPLFDESQSFYQCFGHEQQLAKMALHAAAAASAAGMMIFQIPLNVTGQFPIADTCAWVYEQDWARSSTSPGKNH